MPTEVLERHWRHSNLRHTNASLAEGMRPFKTRCALGGAGQCSSLHTTAAGPHTLWEELFTSQGVELFFCFAECSSQIIATVATATSRHYVSVAGFHLITSSNMQ